MLLSEAREARPCYTGGTDEDDKLRRIKTRAGIVTIDDRLFRPQYFWNLRLKHCLIDEPATLRAGERDYLMQIGVSFHPSGKLASGTLVENTEGLTRQGTFVFAGNTEIRFFEDGYVKSGHLLDDTRLRSGSGSMRFSGPKADSWDRSRPDFGYIEFHGNGELAEGTLVEDSILEVGGVALRFADRGKIFFYPSGAVRSGLAVENRGETVGRRELLLRRYIYKEFDEAGIKTRAIPVLDGGDYSSYPVELKRMNLFGDLSSLAEDTELRVGESSIRFSKRSSFIRNADGSIRGGMLASSALVKAGGRLVELGKNPRFCFADIFFFESGKPQSGYLLNETSFEIRGQSIDFRGEIYFDEEGRVESGFLVRDTLIRVGDNDILFSVGEGYPGYPSIEFYPNGSPRCGNLTQDTALKTEAGELLLERSESW